MLFPLPHCFRSSILFLVLSYAVTLAGERERERFVEVLLTSRDEKCILGTCDFECTLLNVQFAIGRAKIAGEN